MYNCEKCNYVTNKRADYEKHLLTTKHKKNTQKLYICTNCNAVYNLRQSLHAHKKKCVIINQETVNNNEITSINNDLEIKLIKLQHELEIEKIKNQFDQEKIKCEQEKVKMLQDIVKNSNKTTDKALTITDKTISAVKYANEHFNNAPILKPIDNYNIMGYDLEDDEDKKKLVEDIIFYYKKKSIHTLFGKHIISEYKKDNLDEQSLHTTDTTRMNYIVRTIKNNNLAKWTHDKNGIYICNNVIDKLINHHIEILKWYYKILIDEMNLDPGKVQSSLQNKIENISKLLGDIESGQLKKDTNKYIAPFFNLDK